MNCEVMRERGNCNCTVCCFTLTCTYCAQRPEPNTGSDFTTYVATLGIHYLSMDMMATCDTEGRSSHK